MALLDGLRVVEAALLAPNMLGMHLADLGADVIKVEAPGAGDYTRHVGAAKQGELSFLHLRWNRGKRSIVIDLHTDEGADVFRDLVMSSEVVVEGMRAGALERRGLGYAALRELKPSIVFCSLSGLGQTGPYRDLPTHGVAYDAYAGHAPPETSDDGFVSIPRRYLDIGTQAGGLYATIGVLAAVIHARATGEGAYLDVAQADAAVSWNATRLDPLLSGKAPAGAAGPNMQEAVRYQYYATSDDRTVLFAASERHFFRRFCKAVGRDDLVSESDAEFGEHGRGDVTLRRQLTDLFKTRTQAEWVQLFLDADVPGAPVNTPTEVIDDPHFQARFRFIEHEHPDVGPLRLLATPIHTEDLPVTLTPAPSQGEHTDEVLSEIGYDKRRVDDLREREIVH
ncbi:MAG: CoA transferase [Actinobacteria bacterium]|nr:CoA transferase [Actinomycetota bacterium]